MKKIILDSMKYHFISHILDKKTCKEIYKNIIKLGLHRAAVKTPVLPCPDVVEWITRKIDHQHRSILNVEGKVVANYKPSMINQIYHLKEATVKVSPDWFKQKSESTDMLTILKGWWSEGNFKSKPANVEWKTSKFRKTVQIIVILLSRLFRRKDGPTFPDKWIPIIYQIMTSGATLNWGELISSNLDNQLKKVHKDHQFYMSTYLMDVMCASMEFPSFEWEWEPSLPSVHVYHKMLWENKYKEDYDQICNKLFPTLYETLFGEEIPCLSPAGQAMVKELEDWYMIPIGMYIRIAGSTKPPHWLLHFVPNSLLLQEIAYQTFINGVVASLHKHKKGIWPQFPLITPMGKIENFKQAREEVNILSSYKFQEFSFRRHDPQEKLKEHLQQVGFQWSYSHENLLPGELSQQQALFKSMIPTPDQMSQIDKEAEQKKAIKVKWKTSSRKLNIVRIDDEESSSSSSMSLYSIESNENHLEVSS